MKAREVERRLTAGGAYLVRQKGSHRLWQHPNGCATVVAAHPGDIPSGTLHAIEKQMEACLGKGWLARK